MSEPHMDSAARAFGEVLARLYPECRWVVTVQPQAADAGGPLTPSGGVAEAGTGGDDADAVGGGDGPAAAGGPDDHGGHAGGSDVLLDGLAVHDVHLTAASCQHVDGFQVAGTTGPPQNAVTITNSHVYDVDQNADIQLDSTPEGRGTGHVIAANTLDTVRYVATSCVPTPYPRSVTLSGNQIRVENNVAAQPFFVYPGSGSVTGNRAPAPQFSGGASCSTYAFAANVWSANPYGTRCP